MFSNPMHQRVSDDQMVQNAKASLDAELTHAAHSAGLTQAQNNFYKLANASVDKELQSKPQEPAVDDYMADLRQRLAGVEAQAIEDQKANIAASREAKQEQPQPKQPTTREQKRAARRARVAKKRENGTGGGSFTADAVNQALKEIEAVREQALAREKAVDSNPVERYAKNTGAEVTGAAEKRVAADIVKSTANNLARTREPAPQKVTKPRRPD